MIRIAQLKLLLLAGLVAAGAAFADIQTVNVNSADAARLAEVLDGVGVKRAQAIVQYRNEQGAFRVPMDLVNVKGIGVDTVERNEAKIRLQD